MSDTISGPDIATAFCILYPLASALLIHLGVGRLRGRGAGSGSATTQERRPFQPFGKKRLLLPWTHQSLRDYLDSKYLGRTRLYHRVLTRPTPLTVKYGSRRLWSRRWDEMERGRRG